MNIKALYCILILGVITINTELKCQQIQLSGFIMDSYSHERLLHATIQDKRNGIGSVSNLYGFYSLKVQKADTIFLSIAYSGYAQLDTVLVIDELSKKVNFYLKPNDMLEEVRVYNEKSLLSSQTGLGSLHLTIQQVDVLPRLGGESDILKALQLLPGIQGGNEGSSDLIVRGGGSDQNLILLDDAPLYYVNHLGGFVSVFNTDIIKSANMIKGGFPARYGNRLSSVLDIRMKDGNTNDYKGDLSIGLISSKLSYEGPLIKNKTSFIISGRRFMYDLITRPLSRLIFDGVGLGYFFYDFNAKINHQFSEKDRLYLSFYTGDDQIKIDFKERNSYNGDFTQKWGNTLLAVRWNHLFNDKLFSNLTLAHTRYRYSNSIYSQQLSNNTTYEFENVYRSGIADWSVKFDFDYFISNNFSMNFGAKSVIHDFDPQRVTISAIENKVPQIDSVFGSAKVQALENALYVDNLWNVGQTLTGNIGLRLVSYHLSDKDYYFIEPRIHINYEFIQRSNLSISYTVMNQNVHMVSGSGLGFPIDLWLPATSELGPSKAHQMSIGWQQHFKKPEYSLAIEGFYKSFENLVMPKEGVGFFSFGQGEWSDKLEGNGLGDSYGFEVLFEKQKGKLTGWTAYTWSKSNRIFENVNLGRIFPFRYDRRHDLSIVTFLKLNRKINLSATWAFGSGLPITLPVGHYQMPNDTNPSRFDTIDIYDGLNSFRMRAFHRLDVGVNYTKMKKNRERIWNFSVFNVYNRQNPYFYFMNTTETGTKLMQQSLFPIMPSFSYSVKLG